MSVDVVTQIDIGRDCVTVARFASDPDNARRWYTNITEVEWRTPPPLRVGSQIAFVARFLGRRLVYTYEVTELVSGKRLVMRTAEGPFPMETSYEVEPLGQDASRMRLRNRGTPRGFMSLFAPFLSFAMRRENRRDLARLKAILEHAA
jgi:Polyketide cyclase / dehydrase and lipid transport